MQQNILKIWSSSRLESLPDIELVGQLRVQVARVLEDVRVVCVDSDDRLLRRRLRPCPRRASASCESRVQTYSIPKLSK